MKTGLGVVKMIGRILRVSREIVYQDEGTKEQFEEQIRLYSEREPKNHFYYEEVN